MTHEDKNKDKENYYDGSMDPIDRLIGIVAVVLILALGIFLIWSFTHPNEADAMTIDKVDSAELIKMTNGKRHLLDLPEVTENDLLNEAAQMKADDMAEHEYFAHEDQQGRHSWHLAEEVGYKYDIIGENLASEFRNNRFIVSAWWNSESHKANMINPDYREIGIGIAKGKNGVIYVAQIFGTVQQTVQVEE